MSITRPGRLAWPCVGLVVIGLTAWGPNLFAAEPEGAVTPTPMMPLAPNDATSFSALPVPVQADGVV